jgi:hypothetical protein
MPGAGWLLGWTCFLSLSGGTMVLVYENAVQSAGAYFDGHAGTVAPFRDCEWIDKEKDDGWECRGVFTGDGLRIDNVRIRPRLDERPAGPVPATVSGPDATVAWTDHGPRRLVPLAGALLVYSIGPGIALAVYWSDLIALIAGRSRGRRQQARARLARKRFDRDLDRMRFEWEDRLRDPDG